MLLDPIPDIRATCAKALGSIMAGASTANDITIYRLQPEILYSSSL